MAKKIPRIDEVIDTVRASRAGHMFHERWAARRALQLVFAQDRLKAISVEGLSTSETANPGKEAEEIADLALYYGEGDNFASADIVQTVQFKYKMTPGDVTASYLKKTIDKFASSLIGYEKDFATAQVDQKLTFSFITNADFSGPLWEAIGALKTGVPPNDPEALRQAEYLTGICKKRGVDAHRLFTRIEFQASEKDLASQSNKLCRTMANWSGGVDVLARNRLWDLTELIRNKAGPLGQNNSLVTREDVLDALHCEPEDLFPAETRFVKVGEIVPRTQLLDARDLINQSLKPVFIHAEGGVGKTVFVESLATTMVDSYEVVVFDCFGGGAYRFIDQARHLPSVGLIQIVNELALRGLCDPLLPTDTSIVGLVKAARHRLRQAAATIKSQSNKQGLLIILDAVDNAQLEADSRRDTAFPSLLLESLSHDLIDGVKLVLTARTHRMSNVVGRSKVVSLLLNPFSEDEARVFLASRRENVTGREFARAFTRSSGNARVLAYLVETWNISVAGNAPETAITVEQIIEQKCKKIFLDLHVAGWSNDDITEFFSAIALLPPPIPLEELASALGWDHSQVKSAASDLVPMLEVLPHGVIFRDEPTETYIRSKYSQEPSAQQAIAQRLQEAQEKSSYAAEAFPSFLVAISDSDRAYTLASSDEFPSTIHSDFGRRRLNLARLNAAFRLAVNDGNLDRVLKITMRLAQVSEANSRGDEFIRCSPSLAAILGDSDAYRRLFNDRSGWRGARNARLTVTYIFSNEMEEAEYHCDRTVEWINWHARQPPADDRHSVEGRSGPEAFDFASVLLMSILKGEFERVDSNVCQWPRQFALSVCKEAIKLARQFECASGNSILNGLADFAGTSKCKSFVLKISLLTNAAPLTSERRKNLARSLKRLPIELESDDIGFDLENEAARDIIYAAFAALLHDGPASSARVLKSTKTIRPSRYDYGERHGYSRAWLPVLHACTFAWAQSRKVAIHDLLPQEVKVTARVKSISTLPDLRQYLAELHVPRRVNHDGKKPKKTKERQFDDQKCQEISKAIEVILELIEPFEVSILSGEARLGQVFTDYLTMWKKKLSSGVSHHYFENAHDLLWRVVGIGFARLFLLHSSDVNAADVAKLIEIVSRQRFTLNDRSRVLALIAGKSGLQSISGQFACTIAHNIRKSDYIEQRGEDYTKLAEALLEMSLLEAKEYYRKGLAELDKLGSNDYELIRSILEYAAAQPGGVIRGALGHRLMNLCQTICHHEPSKFPWALFGRAGARSVGNAALTKLIRWDNQDVADFSYGLPQLACFLATMGLLDPRRAAAILLFSKDHGWYEWRVGDGLADLLRVTPDCEMQRNIFLAVSRKLKAEHSGGGWPSVWESLLAVANIYPELISDNDVAELRGLLVETERKRDEYNARSSFSSSAPGMATIAKEMDPEPLIRAWIANCNPSLPSDIDEVLRSIEMDKSLPHYTKSRFFDELLQTCPYDKRLGYLFALGEASTVDINDAIARIADGFKAWGSSSSHINAEAKNVIEHLFQHKGFELFNLRYFRITNEIQQLAEICGDRDFIIRLVIRTIVAERLELDGNEWLQLAMTLCKQTSPLAARQALEDLLSGPAAGIADDTGEGPYLPAFHIEDECALISGIVWHLLGNQDAYVRWAVARSLSAFVDLGLVDELNSLIDLFDQTDVPALVSSNHKLSFQNSQQWLLMGLARAALIHGDKLAGLKPRLINLAARPDLHILHKRHILRCLVNLGSEDKDIESLLHEVMVDPNGISIKTGWPEHVDAKSGFTFDYEFTKYEVESLARLFGISEGQSTDAIASEVTQRWPGAKDMDFFPGYDGFERDNSDRYESFRDHVQKHALLSAATTLRKSLPIARQRYDQEDDSPFEVWLKDYDITFEDGSWLADHKDDVPETAKASFLDMVIGKEESIVDANTVFSRLKLITDTDAMVPIFGQWRSPDGVYVRIVSALGVKRGIIARCDAFSKRADHDLWLPMFWHNGYDDPHRGKNPFEPFVWVQENYGVGLDAGEKIATSRAAFRSRLGTDLTSQFRLKPDLESREWRTQCDELVLQNQVWGEWQPDHDNYSHRRNEDGEILWANVNWLDHTLSDLGKQLVYTVILRRYKKRGGYKDATGVKAVYVATRSAKSGFRFWHAQKASQMSY